MSTYEVTLDGNTIYKSTVEADAFAKFERVAADLPTGERVDFLQNGAPLEAFKRDATQLLWLDHTADALKWIEVEG